MATYEMGAGKAPGKKAYDEDFSKFQQKGLISPLHQEIAEEKPKDPDITITGKGVETTETGLKAKSSYGGSGVEAGAHRRSKTIGVDPKEKEKLKVSQGGLSQLEREYLGTKIHGKGKEGLLY